MRVATIINLGAMELTLLLTGSVLASFMEGASHALTPEGSNKLLVAASRQPAAKLRGVGLTGASIGVAIVWLVQATTNA